MEETAILLRELAESGVRHTPEDIVRIARRATDGKIIFIEKGSRRAGLQHILERHAEDFARQGFSSGEIPDIVIKAVAEGIIVGCQGTRLIYEIETEGNRYRIAVTVGSNGYIVGANPVSFP
ncbi:Uncharacterized protein dnm_013450 [Desulfonema magnum]|uniref:DUF4258 domain-containing protein n=2 Tax=Desulfonema magnum TaxID=45655 RepID=A0A975BHF5_9BACT|nr:Uncharacterized protein dnm_013450 [Desulfonema magnum]